MFPIALVSVIVMLGVWKANHRLHELKTSSCFNREILIAPARERNEKKQSIRRLFTQGEDFQYIKTICDKYKELESTELERWEEFYKVIIQSDSSVEQLKAMVEETGNQLKKLGLPPGNSVQVRR